MKKLIQKLRKILSDSEIELLLILLYVDDGRMWVRLIKWGYTFCLKSMKLKFDSEIFLKDSRRRVSAMEKTSEVMLMILNGITPDLKFTMENQSEFSDGHIPT